MDDAQILKKVIEKAMENDKNFKNQDAMYGSILESFITTLLEENLYYRLIFSHDFAKAFWGEKVLKNVGGFDCMLSWAYHLQQMVLEEEPLKYLEKFL